MKRSATPNTQFESLLIYELVRLGAIVRPQFRIPGTVSRVDLYIAFPVRTFVEIKIRDLPTRAEAEQLRLQLARYRQQFGDEIVPVLVVLAKAGISRRSWKNSGMTSFSSSLQRDRLRIIQ